MDVTIADLGRLEGDVLLYGGPRSNLQATQALFARAEALGIPPARRICTGDMVGHGGDPRATADLVMRDGGVVIAGDCEARIARGAKDRGCGCAEGSACDPAARGWYPRARTALVDTGHPARFAAIPDVAVFVHDGRRYGVIHGGLRGVARFVWPDSPASVFAEERAFVEAAVGPVDGIVAGHCGIAFQRRVAGLDWINAGVIGIPPHDGRPATRFVVLGADGAAVVHRLDYDHGAAARAVAAAGLCPRYGRALITGIWPSEDVLPPALRR